MNCPNCSRNSVPEGTRFCPGCGAAIPAAPEEPAARIEVTQEVGAVEGGRLVGVEADQVRGEVRIDEVTQEVGTVEGGELVGVELDQVEGAIVIESYDIRIGARDGGQVDLVAPSQRQQQQRLPLARPVPVRLLPRRALVLLDRGKEIAARTTPLQPAGKWFASAFPDGIVTLTAVCRKPAEDLLLDLFDAFYEREEACRPTAIQLRYSLQDKRALVILDDDVDLGRDEAEEMMDAAPDCAFLSVSARRCLWGGGQAQALRGLSPDDALALIQCEFDRLLTVEE